MFAGGAWGKISFVMAPATTSPCSSSNHNDLFFFLDLMYTVGCCFQLSIVIYKSSTLYRREKIEGKRSSHQEERERERDWIRQNREGMNPRHTKTVPYYSLIESPLGLLILIQIIILIKLGITRKTILFDIKTWHQRLWLKYPILENVQLKLLQLNQTNLVLCRTCRRYKLNFSKRLFILTASFHCRLIIFLGEYLWCQGMKFQ